MAFNNQKPINFPDKDKDYIPLDQLNSSNQDQIIPPNPNLLIDNPEE